MVKHLDKFKTPPSDPLYRENHEAIFGPKKKPKKLTPAQAERQRQVSMERHKKEVRDGKKDAQYYLDHEVRVSQDPNYVAKPENDQAYKDGYDRIFGKKS